MSIRVVGSNDTSKVSLNSIAVGVTFRWAEKIFIRAETVSDGRVESLCLSENGRLFVFKPETEVTLVDIEVKVIRLSPAG